ncbi:hypothetical protein [Castellaniella caeni]
MVEDDELVALVALVDAGIRLGRSLDEHMVAVPITPPLEMAIVGSPAYFERYGVPETPADLARQPLSGLTITEKRAIDFKGFFH